MADDPKEPVVEEGADPKAAPVVEPTQEPAKVEPEQVKEPVAAKPEQAGAPDLVALKAAPQLALARFLFNRPLAISRLGFKQLSDNLVATMRGGTPSLKAIFGFSDDAIAEKPYDIDAAGIATIPVRGALVNRADSLWAMWCGCPSYEGIASAFGKALADPAVKSIVFDMDSPGGDVDGLFDLVDTIYSARGQKPSAAIVNQLAFSAAYAIASATSKIYVPRTGGIGSIGVICEHWDYSGMLEQAGIKVTAIFAGDHKNDGSENAPLSPEAQAQIQGYVDSMNTLFVASTARNRAISEDKIRAQQAALYFGASGAIESGLADVVTSPEQAYAAVAGQSAGQSPLAILEAQLAASRIEADGRVRAAQEGFEAYTTEIIARCEAARRPDLAAKLIKGKVSIEALGDRITDLLAEGQSREVRNILGTNGTDAAADSPIVQSIVAGINQQRR